MGEEDARLWSKYWSTPEEVEARLAAGILDDRVVLRVPHDLYGVASGTDLQRQSMDPEPSRLSDLNQTL
jgi:hypothetical protein